VTTLTDRVDKERTGQRALADVAAQAARAAWEAGDLERAAELTRTCSELDPDRAALWQRRQEEIATAAASSPLAVQCAVRLAAAGIQPDDPGLQRVQEWNAAVRARTAQPEPEAGS
jgi:hypothetical protein